MDYPRVDPMRCPNLTARGRKKDHLYNRLTKEEG